MRKILLIAGAAALALSAGSSFAAPRHHSASSIAGPSQPIPYAELSAYMKASPAQRAKRDWWSGQATAANGANASATSSASPDAPSPTASSANPPSAGGGTVSSATAPQSAPPPIATPPTGEVNPTSTNPATPPK